MTNYNKIKEIKNKINEVLKNEDISNIRVQKRYFKSKYGEIHYIGYAIFGSWNEFSDILNHDLEYKNKSISYFNPSFRNENLDLTKSESVVDRLRSSGLNANCLMRGKSLEIIIVENGFDWSGVSFLNNSFKYRPYKVTKTL